MSTLIGIKLNNIVVLATDSRVMDNAGNHLSDEEQKVFEIAPGTFYGWSGYTSLARLQTHIASLLAGGAEVVDLRTFANQLDAVSLSHMAQLLETLAKIQHMQPQYGDELTGIKPFHAYVLAGISEGCPGFLAREFWLTNGQIRCNESWNFRLPAGNNFAMYATRGELLGDLVSRPDTWVNGPISAAEKFVSHLREVQPLVGGPVQLVCIDKAGARWVHRPMVRGVTVLPANLSTAEQITAGTLAVGVEYAGKINASQITGGTVSATVTLISPVLVITNGTVTINIDRTNYIKLSDSSAAYNAQLTTLGLAIQQTIFGAAYESAVNPTSIGVANMTAGKGMSLNAGASDPFILYEGHEGFTGTLAAAIAAGKNVGGGIIY